MLSTFVLIMHSGTNKMTAGWIWRPTRPLCFRPLLSHHWTFDLQMPLLLEDQNDIWSPWLRGHDSLLMLFEMSFCSFSIKSFQLHKPSKTCTGFQFISLLGTSWLISQCQSLHWSTHFDTCFAFSVRYGKYVYPAFGNKELPLDHSHFRIQWNPL